ncbi:MAG: ankyrin repeat domain-containing protein [Treponema sp.]|nr:ankyrin repeat domain-containing protein [Treponema sp.]
MKKSTFFNTLAIIGTGLFLLAVTGCKSAPAKTPIEDVWSLLAAGDVKARDFFLGEVDINARDTHGRTPLHYAAELGDPQLAAFFIALGANPNVRNNENQSPLGISAEKTDSAVAKVLVTAGADIHMPVKGNTSVARQAINARAEFLQSILNPATMISTDADGRTILHLASMAGNVRAVETILAVMAESGDLLVLEKRDNADKNPLDLAFARPDSRSHMEVAEKLILSGAFSDNPIFTYFAPAVRSANYNVRRGDGMAPLHYAAREGHTGLISFLIWKKADVNIKSASGATPLHEAARSGNVQIMDAILAQGADVDAQDAKGNSPLHIGIPSDKHREAASLFISRGANPNLRDEHGETPLHIAITLNRSQDLIQTLVGGGGDISIRNIEGKTPLYLAVQENRLHVIPILLSYGSDVFAADISGVTPFDIALQKKGEILSALITTETVYQNDSAGNTMLHAAIKSGCEPEYIGLILDKRAMVNARNKEGDSALHIAVRMNQRENGEFLISRGADIFAVNSAGESSLFLALTASDGMRQWIINTRTITARDGHGNSILHYIAQWKLDGLITFIIQNGINVETTNASGETPLFMAVKYNSPSTIGELLGNNANLEARDNLGNSTLHAAVRWNAGNSALSLIESGININAHNLSGSTPLHDAVRFGISDLEILLVRRGANLEVRDIDGNTPFMEAVTAGYAQSMNRLAAAGANPMTRNTRGDTPLHTSVAIERYDLTEILLNMGVSIHARNTRSITPFQISLGISGRMVSTLLTRDRINGPDDFGNSALHVALQEKASNPIIRTIIGQGIRLDPVDSNGRTPLRLAVDLNSWEAAKLIADAGSNPFSVAVDSRTPAEVALAKGEPAIKAVFSGIAVNAKDSSGNTILHYAARQGVPNNITLLIELGANKSIRNISAESPADIAFRWNHQSSAVLLN